MICFQFISEPQQVKAESTIIGTVTGHLENGLGLIIDVAEGCSGLVHVVNASDQYEEGVIERYKIGEVVKCYVLCAREKNRLVLSLRPSRYGC